MGARALTGEAGGRAEGRHVAAPGTLEERRAAAIEALEGERRALLAEALDACRAAIGGDDPGPVKLLQPGTVSAAFRVGPDRAGRTMIAKRLRRGRASEERTLYERILPELPVAVPALLGVRDVPGSPSVWIFVEDLGPDNYRPTDPAHRRLAAGWLAALHAATAGIELDGPLPALGPPHRRERLRSARAAARVHAGDPRFDDSARGMLAELIELLDALEERWDRVEEISGGAPRVLLHGDFVRKNLRLRPGPDGERLVAFDWGEAGWGPPAFDLAQGVGFAASPDLAEYGERLRAAGVEIGAEDVAALAWMGTVFRAVTGASWAAESLPSDWFEDALRDLGVYRDVLREGLSSPTPPA